MNNDWAARGPAPSPSPQQPSSDRSRQRPRHPLPAWPSERNRPQADGPEPTLALQRTVVDDGDPERTSTPVPASGPFVDDTMMLRSVTVPAERPRVLPDNVGSATDHVTDRDTAYETAYDTGYGARANPSGDTSGLIIDDEATLSLEDAPTERAGLSPLATLGDGTRSTVASLAALGVAAVALVVFLATDIGFGRSTAVLTEPTGTPESAELVIEGNRPSLTIQTPETGVSDAPQSVVAADDATTALPVGPEAGALLLADGLAGLWSEPAPCVFGVRLDSTGACAGRTNYGQAVANGQDQETVRHKIENHNHPLCNTRNGRCFIENKKIFGCIDVRTANVTIRNNLIQCYASRDLAGSNSGYTGAVILADPAEGAVVERNELFCRIRDNAPDQAPCDVGVIARRGIVRRNLIAGGVDGVDPSASRDVVIDQNYIHNLTVVWEEWRNDFSHADGIQLDGGQGPATNLRLTNNVIVAPPAEAGRSEQVQGIFALGQSDIVIDGNHLIGVFESFHRITCMRGANCTVRNNVVDVAHAGEAIRVEQGTIEPNNKLSDGTVIGG